MTKKIINIYFTNGDIFQIPAEIVSNDRDTYYKEYLDEQVTDSYEDDELYDWISNNMNWSDLEPHAVRIDSDIPDYNSMFGDSEIEILRKY